MSDKNDSWQKTPPTGPGRWEMRSDETNRQPQPVFVFEMDGELWVEDPDVGTNTLEHYHYNLIAIEWRKCHSVATEAFKELLTMPLPRTLLDFRRAVLLAVLIGRQIEADFQQQQPQPNAAAVTKTP